MKNHNDPIENRTTVLPACRVVAQTTASQRKTSRILNLKSALNLRGQFSHWYTIEGTITFPYILIIELFFLCLENNRKKSFWIEWQQE